jgi:hypothetical protein
MNIAGGYQDAQFVGGMGQVPDAMAAQLGDAVVLGIPVTGVLATENRVVVTGAGADAGCTVSARRVVLALPRALAAGIRFDPVLPADHALLLHQVPAGTKIKMVALYDEPFWRRDGMSGATVATDDDIEVTLDTGQPGHAAGVVAGYAGRATRPRPGCPRRHGTPGSVPAHAHRAPRACGRRSDRGVGAELGTGAMDPGVLHGPLPHRRADSVRTAPARAGRAPALGRHRDRIDVVRRNGRCGALG